MPRLYLAALAALAVATAAFSQPKPVEERRMAEAERGRVVAEARCAACHAVTVNSSSPNPESPGFEDIANRKGLTSATLRQYLRNAHNYPDAMQFKLNRGQVRDLSAYIVTLKRSGYKPAI
jgi:mono/diheme cytochrome c family protein